MPNKVGRIGDYYRPVQISIYGREGYIGTAAYSVGRDGDGYVAGADPWFGKTIVEQKIAGEEATQPANSHRLIDGVYATAVRNAVPASIVGEAIAYLAPMTDLKRSIKPDERVTLVFTDSARDEKRGGGRVLFAGVRRGDDWSVRCYVLKAPGNRGFACVNEGGKVSLSGAMLVPVKGVLTSKFGMRFHPIKKTERLHAGVDWAAPTELRSTRPFPERSPIAMFEAVMAISLNSPTRTELPAATRICMNTPMASSWGLWFRRVI